MKTELFISIIAACSALLGALIPTIIGYLNNLKQNQFEKERTLLEKQNDIYLDLMNSLQNMINNSSEDNFREMQKSVIKMSIYGDNKSATLLNNYYRELIRGSLGTRDPLTPQEHQKYQKEIINGMRRNLGLKSFEYFEIFGISPSN